jgi:hypothetical protein
MNQVQKANLVRAFRREGSGGSKTLNLVRLTPNQVQ